MMHRSLQVLAELVLLMSSLAILHQHHQIGKLKFTSGRLADWQQRETEKLLRTNVPPTGLDQGARDMKSQLNIYMSLI